MKMNHNQKVAILSIEYLHSREIKMATTREISKSIGISIETIYKVLRTLGRTKIIEPIRGRSGGFILSRLVESISLGEIIELFPQGVWGVGGYALAGTPQKNAQKGESSYSTLRATQYILDGLYRDLIESAMKIPLSYIF